MTKSEFLNILKEQLAEAMPASEIYGNIQYYDSYISREIASGKSEAEVMEALGDPRLIAKTLIETEEEPSREPVYEDTWYDDSESDQTQSQESYSQSSRRRMHTFDLSAWYNRLILLLLAVFFVFLAFTIFRILLPLIVILVVVGIIVSLFRNSRW